MWPILKIDARTQTEAAPGEQTEMRCRSANQSLITDVLALRPYFCTIQLQSIRTAQAVWCQITAPRALDGGHQILRGTGSKSASRRLVPTPSPALADIDVGIEADRLAIAPRYRHDISIVVPDRLEQGLRGAPEIVERRIVVGRDIDIGLVGADMF